MHQARERQPRTKSSAQLVHAPACATCAPLARCSAPLFTHRRGCAHWGAPQCPPTAPPIARRAAPARPSAARRRMIGQAKRDGSSAQPKQGGRLHPAASCKRCKVRPQSAVCRQGGRRAATHAATSKPFLGPAHLDKSEDAGWSERALRVKRASVLKEHPVAGAATGGAGEGERGLAVERAAARGILPVCILHLSKSRPSKATPGTPAARHQPGHTQHVCNKPNVPEART